jgi:transposase
MLGTTNTQRTFFFEPRKLRDLIPDDHILAKVEKVLNLTWLSDAVRHLYSEGAGRPSIPPESAMRLMLAGLLLSIAGDRRLMREAQVNIAIRWFAGYELDDELPDHSSLSRIRERWGEELFREAFRKVLGDCDKAGLLGKSTVHIDSTLIRADADIGSVVDAHLEEVAMENGGEKGAKRKKVCLTDPDATMARSNPKDKFEPRYKAHVAVDDKSGVVVDVKVTTGAANESPELIEQVKRVEENVGVRPGCVTADTGYSSGESYSKLEEMGIKPFIIARKEGKRGKCISAQRFKYDSVNQIVKCPAGKILRRSYRDDKSWCYVAEVSDCRACPLKERCVSKSRKSRRLQIFDGHEARLRALRRKARGDEDYTEALKRHKWMVEGRHAEAKVIHGMNRAQRRGLENVSIQVLLTAVVMNLKRLSATVLLALSRIFKRLLTQLQPPRAIFFSSGLFRSAFIPRLPNCVRGLSFIP